VGQERERGWGLNPGSRPLDAFSVSDTKKFFSGVSLGSFGNGWHLALRSFRNFRIETENGCDPLGWVPGAEPPAFNLTTPLTRAGAVGPRYG
jgi:hypothetical protein